MKKSILFLTAILIFCVENNSQAQDSLSTGEMACKSNMVALNVTPILVTLIGAETKNFGVGLNYRRILNDQYRIRADVNVYTNKSEDQMSYAIYADSTRIFDNSYIETERFDFSIGIERGRKIKNMYFYFGVQAHFKHSASSGFEIFSHSVSQQTMNDIQLLPGSSVHYSADSISLAPAINKYSSSQITNGFGIQIPIGFSYFLTENFSIQMETTVLTGFEKSKIVKNEVNTSVKSTGTFNSFNLDLVPLRFFLAYRF